MSPIISGDGGGGGSQPVLLVATVRLSSAAVRALGTTPQVIVAGVAGKVIVPTAAVFVNVFVTTAWVSNASLRVFIGDTWAAWGATLFGINPLVQAATESVALIDSPPFQWKGDAETSASLGGKPLSIDADSAVTGAGDGTAIVTASYYLAPLT